MVNRESGSKPALSPSDAASATRTTVRPVDRARVFRAGLPFLALGSVASAYGFLERNKGHPSLKLGGAFFVAGLAVITVLLDRSMVLRNRSRQAIQHAVLVRRDRRDVLRIALAFLSLDAALVHFAVIEQHLTDPA